MTSNNGLISQYFTSLLILHPIIRIHGFIFRQVTPFDGWMCTHETFSWAVDEINTHAIWFCSFFNSPY